MSTRRLCYCGNIIRSGEIPSDVEWHLLSDVRLFELLEKEGPAEGVFDVATRVHICPECGRLVVHWQGLSKPPTIYIEEPEKLEDG